MVTMVADVVATLDAANSREGNLIPPPILKEVILMSCSNCNKLCDHLIISDSVTFTDDTLVINIPQGSYCNNGRYCIVVAQNIPDTTTIVAPVVITIGTGATTYPLTYSDCTNVYACSINTRTRYCVKVHTDIGGGTFSLLKKLPCSHCINRPAALPVETTTPAVEANLVRQTKKVKEEKANA